MINYKKIIKNHQTRLLILKYLSFIPDKLMLKVQYRIKLGRKLSLKNPVRFTEKIQWYKLNYRNPLMPVCVDKYSVREFVESKKLSSILNEVYGVYSNPEDIDFNILPNQFVIKTTDGSGGCNVFICKDKKQLNVSELMKQLNAWKNRKDDNAGREWAYTEIKESKYIIEKYLENEDNPEAGINDYKIFCFKGKPKYIVMDIDRYIEHKRNFYDTQWRKLNVGSDCPNFDREISAPDNLKELLQTATILSKDFPHVRVDLYNIKNQIIFGELTFYPWGGYVQFIPDKFDFELGACLEIPEGDKS
jgi:hypothetical protein